MIDNIDYLYDEYSASIHKYDDKLYELYIKSKIELSDADDIRKTIHEMDELRRKIKGTYNDMKNKLDVRAATFDEDHKKCDKFFNIYYDVNRLEYDFIKIYERVRTELIPDNKKKFYQDTTSILPIVYANMLDKDNYKINPCDCIKFKESSLDESKPTIHTFINTNIVVCYEKHTSYTLFEMLKYFENLKDEEIIPFLDSIYLGKNEFEAAIKYRNILKAEKIGTYKSQLIKLMNELYEKLKTQEDFSVDKIVAYKRLSNLYKVIEGINDFGAINYSKTKKKKYITIK